VVGNIQFGNNQSGGIDLKSSHSLYYQLKELIKRQIAQNIWKLDEMIPSENELAATYGLSVGTVKKALSVLVDEGVLYRRQGRGTFVARPDFKRSFIRFFRYNLSDDELGEFPSSKVLSSDIVTPSSRIRKILNLSEKDQVLTIKRVRFLKDLPLMIEDLYLSQKIFKGFEQVDISKELLYPIYDTKYNTPIIWADEFLWPKIANTKIATVLEIEPGDPVISIERIAYTHGDEPAEFRSSVGRGDRFRYHMQIR
jgi:GntR family transcriptional regulator